MASSRAVSLVVSCLTGALYRIFTMLHYVAFTCDSESIMQAAESNVTRLREHMKSGLSAALDPGQKAVRIANPAGNRAGETAIQLVSQVGDAIRSIEAQAADAELRAHKLAQRAVEKFKVAELRLEKTEAARVVAERSLHNANARARKAEQACEEAKSLLAEAQNELTAMDQRVKAAEERAAELAVTLRHVEDAMRTQLLGLQRRTESSQSAAA